MKRVLLLSTVHPFADPRIVYKIAPALARRYEVMLALPGLLSPGQTGVRTSVKLPRFRQLLFRLLFCHPVVLWKCLRFRPDVVHIFVPELIPLAFVFRFFGARIVYEIQENLYKKFALKRYNNEFIFRYFFHLFDHLARRNFYCILTEDAYRDEYRKLRYPSAIIHNYAALPFLDSLPVPSKPLTDRPFFIYSGVISLERSFDILVAAVALLVKTCPEVQIHLFGPIRFSEGEMELLPHFKTIQPNLVFYGYTDQRVALAQAHKAIAGLALLKPVGDYPDSYTTKLFEYMALRIPVITSDFPLYQQVVEKHRCGFCVSPYDAPALAERMQELVADPAERQIMGERGREAVKNKYNWQSEERILMEYYRTILGEAPLAEPRF
ncbi:glycosyltransferase [Salmonirosea aquatica]|uniref:Glycosyltransferase n=1 Tax=Salmonirosea aquatica TaxID=2654236 RepID=A0A7C9BC64_9BACT|nr:glycosyltransferase [Cytophagaceae bacterium SJW1-29]